MALLAVGFVHFIVAEQARGEEIGWEHEFVFTELPSTLNSGWKPHGGGGEIMGDALVLDPGDREYIGWIFNGGPESNGAWDGSQPTTVEFRLRVLSPAVGASITVSNGDRIHRFSFKNRDWETYRIVLDAGVATLYRANSEVPVSSSDGKPVSEGSGGPIGNNSISFGKLYSKLEGISEWQFLRWTHREARPPEENPTP